MPETSGACDRAARVVVGIDPSRDAALAAEWAAREALARDAVLTVVTAIAMPALAEYCEPTGFGAPRHRQGRDLLAATAADLAAAYPKLQFETELSEFDPAHTLMALSKDADLLVTGTRGHGSWAGVLLGSVSRRLAGRTRCPLVVVPREQPQVTRPEVVVGVGEKEAGEPIDFAFEYAAAHGLTVRAVRAYGPLRTQTSPRLVDVETGRQEAEFAMEGLLGAAREHHPDVALSMDAVCGDRVEVLLAAGHGARLVVVGGRQEREHSSLRPGHTAHGLLSQTSTPVAVVPAPLHKPDPTG